MVVRRRYYFWLLKAYAKRWGKIILLASFGSIFFFTFIFFSLSFLILPYLSGSVEKIGITGSYTPTRLPEIITNHVSQGLTGVTDTQEVTSQIAEKWIIDENGKKYTFVLKNDLRLNNGKKFTASHLPYNFSDVTKKVINDSTIEFTLKDPFSPFLSIVSSPILVGNAGFGEYKISKITQEAGFVKSVTLASTTSNSKKIYYFYPTYDALKTAFELGEIDYALGLVGGSDIETSYESWKNVKFSKNVQYAKLVSLFFNTSDEVMGDKKIRQALTYALPEEFSEGERTYSYIPPKSIFYSQSPNEGIHDVELAKSLLVASDSGKMQVELSTSYELFPVAQKIADAWKKVGIETTIKKITGIPSSFQILLYSMNLPKDPDMYTLWHSGQNENLSNYKNVRIDKLFADGRLETSLEKRIEIYSDIQKYLIDDSPAAFLYFPYEYTLRRR